MRTDPRKACANEKQLLLWAIIHDLVAHPLMALTGYSAASLRFHDVTSRRAWPRDTRTPATAILVPSDRFGMLRVRALQPIGFFEIRHGMIAHCFVTSAADVTDAVEKAEEWFAALAELIPHSLARFEEVSS